MPTRYSLATALAVAVASSLAHAQPLEGTVQDGLTGQVLPFARVGVPGYNVGTVSDERGDFVVDAEGVSRDGELVVAHIGYGPQRVGIREARDARPLTVRLTPRPPVAVPAAVPRKPGRAKTLGPKRADVGLACGIAGSGSEMGLRVGTGGHLHGLKRVNFLLGEVTLDSILFRVHVYRLGADGLPGEPALPREVFARAKRGDTWVSVDLSREHLTVDEDVVVSVEAVSGYSAANGARGVCYGVGAVADPEVFVRRSSMDAWRAERYPHVMLTVDVERYKG